jgi:hypothetical protein
MKYLIQIGTKLMESFNIDMWWWLWCLTPLKTIFNYIVAVGFIGEGN